MIGIIFEFGSEIVEVRINDTNCLFRNQSTNGMFATIEDLKLDKNGCIKEHPDLKDRKDWREETIKRFKIKLKELRNEDERMKYIIKDLSKHGYKPMSYQKQGFRVVKIK